MLIKICVRIRLVGTRLAEVVDIIDWCHGKNVRALVDWTGGGNARLVFADAKPVRTMNGDSRLYRENGMLFVGVVQRMDTCIVGQRLIYIVSRHQRLLY